jgi:SAM-dependent methyltransferase
MTIDSQRDYWNRVANVKVFTHPINMSWLDTLSREKALIVDYGCGYGRVVKMLSDAGFANVIGFDTSTELIDRGKKENVPCLFFIEDSAQIPIEDASADCIMLFAVLTCIPPNSAQRELLALLHRKLKKDGILYISDYYLQENSSEMKEYGLLDNDKDNYGVFTLAEGATFRHHSRKWINSLLEGFETIEESDIAVNTMNGHSALAFQRKCRKK